MRTLNIKLFALLLVLIGGGLMVSCGGDDEDASPNLPGDAIGSGSITLKDTIFTIAENPATGTLIGSFAATASNGASITYRLGSQSIAGAVSVAASSGKLTVDQPASFDYETNKTISGQYVVTAGSESDSARFTINITDVDETQLSATDFVDSLAENSATGTVIGQAIVNIPSGSPTYAIEQQTPAGAVSINAQGEFIVADSSLFDHDTHPKVEGSYKVSVGTDTETARFTIHVVSEENVQVSAKDFTGSVDENQAKNTVIGQVDATVTGGSATYTIVSQSVTGAMSINALGKLLIADAGSFDYETNKKITGKYKVTAGAKSATANFTININDVTENTLTAADFTGNVDENSVSGTVIGKVSTTIPAGSGAPTYTIVNQSARIANTNPAVAINAQGQLTIDNAGAFNYEARTQITGTYQITVDNNSAQADFTITINDVAEATVSATDFTGSIDENEANGTVIGRVSTSVTGGSETPTYSIVSQSLAGAVSINNDGDLTVADVNKFDYETDDQITGTYQASVSGNSATASFTIDIKDKSGWTVTVIAGKSGTAGYAIGVGANARFNEPMGLDVNASGTLFVADRSNHRIREITTSGWAGTFAGSTRGNVQGRGTAAQLNSPTDIVVDGNRYWLADRGNNAIREITSTGYVFSYSLGFAPRGLTISGSKVYISRDDEVKRWDTGSKSFDSYLIQSGLDSPRGMDLDASGNLYIADYDDNEVHFLDQGVSSPQLIAKPGGFYRAADVAVAPNGKVYVVESGNNRVRELTATGVALESIIATGFNNPQGITIDNSGNIYISDTGNHCIKKLTFVNE